MNETRKEILAAMDALSRQYPEMRFGQLVVNAANWATQAPDCVWDVEDEQFLEAVTRHLESRDRLNPAPSQRP